MATEFKLAYTGNQINERLRKIDDLALKSDIPTKTSDLTNNSGFVNADYVKEYAQPKDDYALKSDIPSVPVQSVNGKTGAVSLSASDVGARPSTWMPSASDVGALPSTTKIPAKTSELTNDSGFITGYTETDPTVPAWAKNATKPSYTASEVGALPSTTKIPSKTSDLTNDSGFITGYTETDPTVPAWAKASSKPSYTKSEVGLANVDNVKQYSASNPPPYPVTSVNGKTGAVTIDIPNGEWFVMSDTAPSDTSVVWVDMSDDSNDGFQEAVNIALAQAKASGEFNGKDGYTPVKGVDYSDGTNGTNGKTPVKGTDYFTAADKSEMVNAVLAALPVYAGEVV